MTYRDDRALRLARQQFPPIWVIYDHPRDYPDGYVVRVWYGMHAWPEATRVATIDAAREYAQRCGACVLMPRDASDDPVIAESWI